MAPETTCISPALSSRQAPVLIFVMPLRSVGNSAACQPNSRSSVKDRSQRPVASSIISTTPSTLRSAGLRPPMSKPRRRATDERTCSASRFSPSISLVFQNVFGQGLEDGFLLKVETEAFHLSDEAALPVTNRSERLRELLDVPMEVGPVPALVNIHSPHLMRILLAISASAHRF